MYPKLFELMVYETIGILIWNCMLFDVFFLLIFICSATVRNFVLDIVKLMLKFFEPSNLM